MHNCRRAARIKAIAVILFLVLAMPASAKLENRIAPGTAYIRITSQAIVHDHRGFVSMTAFALYNRHISPYSIGNAVYRCTMIGNKRTLPRSSQFCNVVYRLPLGQIVATGVMSSPFYYALAIVGGTGYYKNIGGEVHGLATSLKPHKEKLVFTVIAY